MSFYVLCSQRKYDDLEIFKRPSADFSFAFVVLVAFVLLVVLHNSNPFEILSVHRYDKKNIQAKRIHSFGKIKLPRDY